MPGTRVVSTDKRSTQARLIQDASTSLAASNGSGRAMNHYLKADAKTIVSMIAKKELGWTASAVVGAYIQRAIFAHETTNCLTEGMYYTSDLIVW